MKTVVTGFNSDSIHILKNALERRNHQVVIGEPDDELLNRIENEDISLVLLSDISDQGLRLCRLARASERGKHRTIIAVISKDQMDHLHRVLDAEVDQYITESLFDEQRLDVRLAFAEKMARNKEEQFLIEQKLRESEARARSILKTTVDAIITIDRHAQIRTFNQAAENLFLYKASEVIGKNVKLLMPQPYRREHDDYINNYHQTGHKKIIGIGREVTGLRKDGTTFPMYLAVSEVNVNGQRLYTGIVRDITEQRRLEQEVLRISEHERHRIGQDLHDGLGQMLTGISLINRNIANSLREDGHELAEEVDDITRLVKEADEYARSLSRGLIPVEFEGQGLKAALERMLKNAEKLFNITCRLDIPDNLHFEDSTSLTHLYRIIQEATNNAVKHGNASEVYISIEPGKERIVIKIEDNGTGFSDDWEEERGLGVRIMHFRSRLIGANLDIATSEALGGAKIIITLYPVGNNYSFK
ncbi:sensor histidine kinase [Rhodohalobacter halophilus]|uniref:sensor histidine kinase n=1 Tax=Rhodohalobacter halophilus TaxID=1812810 RepID=UPI00083F6FEA|nr:PAS domain S-box protein [Rhodohalobacter halophilus]